MHTHIHIHLHYIFWMNKCSHRWNTLSYHPTHTLELHHSSGSRRVRPVRARPNSTGPAVWHPAATPRGPPRPGPSAVGKAGRTRWAGWINSHEFFGGFPWDFYRYFPDISMGLWWNISEDVHPFVRFLGCSHIAMKYHLDCTLIILSTWYQPPQKKIYIYTIIYYMYDCMQLCMWK